MSLPSPPAKHDSSARLRSSSPDFTQEETINGEPEIGNENKHEPDHAPSNAAFAAPSEDVTLAPTTANDLGAQFSDTGSTYYSARSRISFRSFFTRSTGKRSQNGATWLQALTKTMNSGFGTGTLVTEGRERGGYLPPITGVGRTGKAPAPVPASMLEALGVKVPEADIPVKSAPIYGLTLEALHERDGTLVPSLVHAVIELVELHGLEVKDIYIGVLADVDMENEVFEGLQNNDLAALKNATFTDPTKGISIEWVAELLIGFFTQLPDPLLTAAFFPAFLKAVDTKDKKARREHMHHIILNLPEANYFTLKVLMEHLRRLVQKSSVNDAETMSGCWAHALMWGSRQSAKYGPKIGLQIKVVQTILENCDQIFSEESVNHYGRGR